MKELTDSEKAALYFQLIENEKDWQRVYAIAIGKERFNALVDTAKQSNASRWKVSTKIRFAYEDIKRILTARKEEIEQKAIQEYLGDGEPESPQTAPRRAKTKTDFLNRDEFLQFLNVRANEITDDKLRNDILKMLSDNLRYKESDKDNDSEVQRFYTPTICKDCAIYKKCGSCEFAQCPRV